MPRTRRRLVGWLVRGVATVVLAVVALAVGGAVNAVVNLPDLGPWHRLSSELEPRAADIGPTFTLDDYLAREDAVFREARERVDAVVSVAADPAVANRYVVGLRSAPSDGLRTFSGARLGLCLPVGISLIAVRVFVAESVPPRVGVATLVMYQVMGVYGIILGLLFTLLLADSTWSGSWRIMLGLASVPALILLPIIAKLPETARWYVMKGRGEEALASLNLTDPDADHEAEIAEMEEIQRAESGGALAEMLRKPYLRATVFVVGLGFFIQITGINATVTYGPQIFEAMGVQSDSQKILMSLLVQVFALISVRSD